MEFFRGMKEFFTETIPAITSSSAPPGFFLALGKAASFVLCLLVVALMIVAAVKCFVDRQRH